MDPLWKNRLTFALAAFLAVGIGWLLADDGPAVPGLVVAALAILAVVHWRPEPLIALVLGTLIFGYFVGNRGFAQLSPTQNLPLLPGEIGLGVSLLTLVLTGAFRCRPPVRIDLLGILILAWLALGLARLVPDVRQYGFLAVRDFAMVYYALFFFVAQEAARDPAGRRFVHGSVLAGAALLLPLGTMFYAYPDFFLGSFTVHGVPLIYYKGDLLGTFMAVGALTFFLWHEARPRWWAAALSVALMADLITITNRASVLGLVAATALLATAGRWRLARLQLAAGTVGVTALALVAFASHQSWRTTPLHDVYDGVISLVDVNGEYQYEGDLTASKGDNNRFRSVWWRTVFDETLQGGPWLGLGFGYDLTSTFMRNYQPESDEEYFVRSPHNIFLTVFARQGLAGLAVFAAIVATALRRTWRSARNSDWRTDAWPWCAACAVLVSASFGVVLEGPMGAVVFWTLLGLGNGVALGRRPPGASGAQANPAPSGVSRVAPEPADGLPEPFAGPSRLP